ncbi:NADPH2:quinone reductase [Diaminobutyricimonas aerilata]|uniref:NADPH2:quinone reductase n=1 Tax=Diaminobutyricimonas aerilata TaxID=1162967 RepID=A0A2M9CFM7_9MICO|nr:NADPH:quinone reductase [Diaminobutyricimonas aerilata]PJJ70652.1 NADPH2:quinone reductase [Diaminobutyricimonas aerilata]
MKAIIYTTPGDSSRLTLVDRSVPDPAPGEVRVRVVVSGVNPTDWKAREGSGSAAGSVGESVPNQDGAGIVDAVGEGVSHVRVGDRVWLVIAAYQRPRSGTAQEYTVVPADRVIPLPDEADFELGASLGVPALTAHRALTVAEDAPDRLHPGALRGRTVLVAGGAGAVGHAAIQLARWSGARVITTVSNDAKAALARAAGAHDVVDYTQEDAVARIRALAPDGVDQVVEVAVSANDALNTAVVRERATIATYANDRGRPLTVDVGQAMRLNLRYQFVLLYTVGAEAITRGAEDVNAAIRDGALPIGEAAGLPLHRFPLERTADAHDAVQNNTVGKVLIQVQQP